MHSMDIKEELEHQIDIVLRLEEERIILLKENKFQKTKIKELSTIINNYSTNSNKSVTN